MDGPGMGGFTLYGCAVSCPAGPPQRRLNAKALMFTASVNVMVMTLFVGTSLLLCAGSVDTIDGGGSTVMLIVFVAVCGPPVPVLPWSLRSICSVAAPV